jgi:DNA-binding CsgD family transcriptional regulator
MQVAQLISEGNDYKTVALSLGLSPATIKTHVGNIFSKLGINDKALLAAELSKLAA